MPLTNKQKKYITNNRNKSHKDLADLLNLSPEEVKNFIDTIPSKKYPKWFYVIPFLIPFVFILLLELILNTVDYGYNHKQWIKVNNTHYMLNRDIARRYFYNVKNVPIPMGNVFEIEKSDNSFRVFVMGGSSAAGFPFTPSGSFAKYIRKRLELVYPESKVEMVNLAFAAINSYSLRDMLPGVLQQKPDLILIYAGHNEYYGALGAGSMESLGSNRDIVNTLLYLNKYKTVQFLRDIIKWTFNLFSTEETQGNTLMAKMALDQSIAIDSEIYQQGLQQFEGNLKDILGMIKDAGVPVIISELSSNIKDQKPFISSNDNGRSADRAYYDAVKLHNAGDYDSAKIKFIEAKDFDELRFRAPSELNRIIEKISTEFGVPLIRTDSAFAKETDDGIVGKELMTDHLHPTIVGYQIIGKLFYEKMTELNYLPPTLPVEMTTDEQHYRTRTDYDLTELDKRIAEYRIIFLRSDWPYTDQPISHAAKISKLKMQTYLDTLAFNVVQGKMDWERAHRELAQNFLVSADVKEFKAEMDALIDHFPASVQFYKFAAIELLNIKEYDESYSYLEGYYLLDKDDFSCKWLGIIDLSKNKVKSAIQYLEESLVYNSVDAQVLFNLAGAYSLDKQYRKGLDTINRCLVINPNFSGARGLRSQLQNVLMNQDR